MIALSLLCWCCHIRGLACLLVGAVVGWLPRLVCCSTGTNIPFTLTQVRECVLTVCCAVLPLCQARTGAPPDVWLQLKERCEAAQQLQAG